MLALTPNAIEAIKGIIGPEASGGAGLRISTEGSSPEDAEFDLGVEDGPSEGDEILETDGVLVFLEGNAAALLTGMVLDAEGHDDHFHFSLEPWAT